MQNTQKELDLINTTRDAARGHVAVTSCVAGWPSLLSVHMGRVAEPAITARLIEGVEANEAIAESIVEAELMAAMEIFAKTMAKGKSADVAFEAVLSIKRKTMSDMPEADKVLEAAEGGFKSAIEYGMSPYAALVAANIAASAIARILAKSAEQNLN